MNASTLTPCTLSGVGCHCEPIPERFQIDMFITTAGDANNTLLSEEPCANTFAAQLSNADGVSAAELTSSRFDWTNSSAPPAKPCGSLSGATAAAKERAPKKPIASHFCLCLRPARLASFAGSRPPYNSIAVCVPVNDQVVRVVCV